MLCWMCDFMLSIWSLREEKNEFQLFLILRVPARSVVKRPQGVRWQESEFYLRKLRRDTVVLIPAEVQVKYRVVQGVHRLVETLKVIN